MTDETDSATVLIVEDEETLADLFALFLASTYTVHTAYDGACLGCQFGLPVGVVSPHPGVKVIVSRFAGCVARHRAVDPFVEQRRCTLHEQVNVIVGNPIDTIP